MLKILQLCSKYLYSIRILETIQLYANKIGILNTILQCTKKLLRKNCTKIIKYECTMNVIHPYLSIK